MGRIYDTLELLGPRLLVRPLPDVEFTMSGRLVKPDSARQVQNRGIVEKVGPGEFIRQTDTIHEFKDMTVEVGDLVCYQKYAGTWVVLDELDRLMLMEDEVQARIKAADVGLVSHASEQADDLERRIRAIEPERNLSISATEHLTGEPCLICLESATIDQREETARTAKANLEAMRAELVHGAAPSISHTTEPRLVRPEPEPSASA